MAAQPFKGDGEEGSGEIKRKCQRNVSKYVTVKAIVKFMRRASLLCCKLVGGDKRVTRKATRRLKYDFFLNHYTLVVYQQKTTVRAQLQHKHVNESHPASSAGKAFLRAGNFEII